jgi:plastocyanin
MRRLLSTLLAAGLVAAIPASAAQTVTVRISGKGFSPSSVKLNAGDSVGWVNDDTQSHQVVADTGAFASPILKHGQSYLFTFAKGGKFTYHDAFKSSLRGDVTVKGPPPTLTFGASAPIVVAGTAVALTGTVSNGAGGESVAILSKPYGQAAFAQVATIQTGTGGGFSYSIVPTLYTTYEAQWKTATSAPIILQVKPKITSVSPNPASVGSTVTLTITIS